MNIQSQWNHSPIIIERDTYVYEENRKPLQFNKKQKINKYFNSFLLIEKRGDLNVN